MRERIFSCDLLLVAVLLSLMSGCPGPTTFRYAPSNTSIERVRGVPAGPAEQKAIQAVETFNRLYGRDFEILLIEGRGTVTDVSATVEEMIRTMAISAVGGPSEPRIFTFADVSAAVPPSELTRLRTSLAANLSVGDTLVNVRIQRKATGTTIESLNSIRADGSFLSGTFFGTARGEQGGTNSVQLSNTVCTTRVLSTYLWGSPAETARGCVRVRCEGNQPFDCKVTDTDCFGGFFGECKIVPLVGTNGSISGSCCDGFFNYAWATGFKKVKVAADGVSLEIEGNIGQMGNGGFTATECCPNATP